jgi:GIY-YIG catalytic domain-containing protein
MKRWVIYVLICPVEQQVRYVGATSVPLNTRLSNHKRSHNKRIAKWVAWLRAQGLIPFIAAVDECYGTREDAEQVESQYIYFYLARGCHLFNKNHVLGDEGFVEYLRQDMNEAMTQSHLFPPDLHDRKLQHSGRIAG